MLLITLSIVGGHGYGHGGGHGSGMMLIKKGNYRIHPKNQFLNIGFFQGKKKKGDIIVLGGGGGGGHGGGHHYSQVTLSYSKLSDG